MATESKVSGQSLYEADVKQSPLYHDGTPRKAWSDISSSARSVWEDRARLFKSNPVSQE